MAKDAEKQQFADFLGISRKVGICRLQGLKIPRLRSSGFESRRPHHIEVQPRVPSPGVADAGRRLRVSTVLQLYRQADAPGGQAEMPFPSRHEAVHLQSADKTKILVYDAPAPEDNRGVIAETPARSLYGRQRNGTSRHVNTAVRQWRSRK